MSTWSLTLDRYVAASPAHVWAVVTDLEGTTAALPGVVSVERLSDDGPGNYAPGTRWRETRRMFGQDATEEMEVVEVEPLRRTVIHAEHGATRYVTGFELEPAGNGEAGAVTGSLPVVPAGSTGTGGPGRGTTTPDPAHAEATLLRFHFAAEPAGTASGWRARAGRALTAVTAPLGVAATRSAMRRELDHLARLAEQRAALA